MRIVVNHLTRMQPGYICVAGIDIETACHIRPKVARGRLSAALLRRNGGPFSLGAVVDLGPTRPVGCPPETEDHLFSPEWAAHLYDPNPADYWEFLTEVARPDLTAIFGPELQGYGTSCTVEVGTGAASLGCFAPPSAPRLHLDHRGRIRIELEDETFRANLSVTDLRLYEADGVTPRRDLVSTLARLIDGGERTLLGVGLTMPWRKEGDAVPRHWLQVTSIHLEADPVWNEHPAPSG